MPALPNFATSSTTSLHWNVRMQEPFDKLKMKLTIAAVLAFPDFKYHFIMETYASSVAVRAVFFKRRKTVNFIQFTLPALSFIAQMLATRISERGTGGSIRVKEVWNFLSNAKTD